MPITAVRIPCNIDRNECFEQTDNCSIMDNRHMCSNTMGSFSCVCKRGYGGDNCEGTYSIIIIMLLY